MLAFVFVLCASESSLQSQYNLVQQGDNLVWSAALTLAWQAAAQTTAAGKLQFLDSDSIQGQLANFNSPRVALQDLDLGSYCMGSGFGSQALTQILDSCEHRFPGKDFKSQLPDQPSEQDYISFAYIAKNLAFEQPFKRQDGILFKKKSVVGLRAETSSHRQNVIVVEYKNNSQFIVRLKLKESEDQLFIAQGYESMPDIPLDYDQEAMGPEDSFSMPFVSLSVTRQLNQFKGKVFLNPEFRGLAISQLKEVIKFELDQTGVKLQNSGLLVASRSLPRFQRRMNVNSDFWVLLRKRNHSPYFFARVSDTQWLTLQ